MDQVTLLKAAAYDCLARIEHNQSQLKEINAEIGRLLTAEQQAPTVEAEAPKEKTSKA